jgi:hypothetical protein
MLLMRTHIVALVAGLVIPTAASGQALVLHPAGARPRVTPTLATAPPVIDGKLDEPLWKIAARVDRFVQQRPTEGGAPTDRTNVYLAYDRDTLYFAFHVYYSDLSLMRANRVDRDQTMNDDVMSVFFDPFQDQQRGYAFSVNGYGVQADWTLGGASVSGGQASIGDMTWDALFQTGGVQVEDGWTAEMAIPIKSLRYPSKRSDEAHQWGFQISRETRALNETDTWSPVSLRVLGFLPQMGELAGMKGLSTRRNFEVMPTVTAVQAGRLSMTTGQYRTAGVEEAGVNLKYGLTSNLTLDFTYNPDFSQIESDQPQIEANQRFPLLFAELRPFFLEGQEIFRVPGPVGTLVHTRTIVDPQYGLKLSGKVGRTLIGIVAANDGAPGKVDDPTDPLFGQTAQVFAARARFDVYRQSYIGLMFTDREFASSYSRLGMVDGAFAIGPSFRTGFQVVYSDRRGLDGRRRTAPVFNADFRKEGRNLTYFGAHNDIHPDFGSDLAFVRRVGQHQTVGRVNYRWWPKRYIVNWGPGASYNFLYNYDGVKTDDQKQVSWDTQFQRNISLNTSVVRHLERFRGVNFYKTRVNVSGTLLTNRKILVRADANFGDQIRFVANPFLGRSTVFNATVTLRPTARFQSLVTINTTHFTDVRTDKTDFDVKIVRALSAYQFTPRLLVRNIVEFNTLSKTYGVNVLGTYRVNAGTAVLVGYDDRYRQGNNAQMFATDEYQRTNRAVFAKVQYLYRY